MKRIFSIFAKNLNEQSVFVLGVFCSFSVLFYYYNQFWYPPDDGAYAYVADRILAGDVLNRDVHDIHMGYINFLHAVALKVFGNDMASLRIPLLILGVIQSAIIYTLLKSKGSFIAFSGVVAITSLSFIQFLNPTANWYGLFLTILVIFSLEKIPDNYRCKFIIIGYILMTLFLFRQLSGVITSLGVITYILYSNREDIGYLGSIFSKIVFAIMVLGLSMYLYFKTPLSAILLFGLWPIVILCNGFLFVNVNNKKTLKILTNLLIGGVISAAPLLVYHIYHGSISSWYNDTVISALMLTDLSFIQKQNYFDYLIYSVHSILQYSSIDAVLNGLYWIFLILISFILGLIVFLNICVNNHIKLMSSALPMVAVFYSLISVHFQIPIYLYYTVGLSICGFLWVTGNTSMVKKNIIISMLIVVSFVAIYFHAAQPTERSLAGILQGKRIITEKVFLEGKVNLWVTPKEAEIYNHIQELVQKHVGADETIFAFPSNSEIYYITERSNPFRFYNSSFGIRNKQQFDQVMSTLKLSPPRMIFFNPSDKYNTENTVKISQYIRDNYSLLISVNGMEYYLLP